MCNLFPLLPASLRSPPSAILLVFTTAPIFLFFSSFCRVARPHSHVLPVGITCVFYRLKLEVHFTLSVTLVVALENGYGSAPPPCPVWLLLPSKTARALHARSLHRRRRSSLFRYLITLSPENRLARSLSVAATEKKTGAAQAGDSEIDGIPKVEGEEGRGATRSSSDNRSQRGPNRNRNFPQFPPSTTIVSTSTSSQSVGRRNFA